MNWNNIIVIDCETARSAEDCRHCGKPEQEHLRPIPEAPGLIHAFEPIGWENKPALGLSIGCFWDYADSRIHWFDTHTLEQTMHHLVARKPLMVSYNGIAFDFPLMRGILRQREYPDEPERQEAVHALCDAFKVLASTSYDILAEIWRVQPKKKQERGLNSLSAIAAANGLGLKFSSGAQAPRVWAAGRWADVLNYCQSDVYLTKALFEKICRRETIIRKDGVMLVLPLPQSEGSIV